MTGRCLYDSNCEYSIPHTQYSCMSPKYILSCLWSGNVLYTSVASTLSKAHLRSRVYILSISKSKLYCALTCRSASCFITIIAPKMPIRSRPL